MLRKRKKKRRLGSKVKNFPMKTLLTKATLQWSPSRIKRTSLLKMSKRWCNPHLIARQ